jgi:tetratricopeptide (TPR) repeat protein
MKRDETVSKPIIKIFENPEYAGKYLIMLKDRPKALFIVAKLSERISKYFKGEEGEAIYNIFLKSVRMIKDTTDTSLKQSLFLLVKEAIERRMNEGDFETAASLISEFYSFGFKNQFKKILFTASELAEKGDFERTIKILNSLSPSEIVRELRTQIYFEWGKKLFSLKNYTSAEIQLREALKFSENEEISRETRFVLAEVLRKLGRFEESYRELSKIEPQNPVEEIKILRNAARTLMEWGEFLQKEDADSAIDKFNEAYQIAMRIGDTSIAEIAFKKAQNTLKLKKED